jgi:8-oxo-dGTP pyrophosphatase MutT (NUDIX family)
MNSQLYDQNKQYPIPKEILVRIQAKLFSADDENSGTKRAKNLLKNGVCNYGMLKRLKNFFDYLDPNTQHQQYELAGGQPMKSFVEKTLQSERSNTNSSNQTNNTFMPSSAMDNTLHGSSGDVNMDLSESEVKGKKKRGALAVIVNEDDKVLIVKRSPFRGSWMPNKHGLIGGGIEKGEEPIDAARREAIEESGLKIEHFVDSFNIVSPPNTVDYVFIAKAPKNQEVKLNEEHTEYKWVTLDEVKLLQDKKLTVPMLYECIELALNKLKEKSIYKK